MAFRAIISISTLLIVGALFCGCATKHSAVIDPTANETLKKMSDSLDKAQNISLEVHVTMERQIDTGQMVHLSRHNKVILARPNKLYAESRTGGAVWKLWYDSGKLTILDETNNVFAQESVPATVDKMLDYMVSKYELVLPISDLLFPHPYNVLTADVKTGSTVGSPEINGVKCKQLLFDQDNISWQIWIEDGKEYLPCKMLIDYKNEEGRPQFTANISKIDLAPNVDTAIFTPQLPPSSKKVNADVLLSEYQGE